MYGEIHWWGQRTGEFQEWGDKHHGGLLNKNTVILSVQEKYPNPDFNDFGGGKTAPIPRVMIRQKKVRPRSEHRAEHSPRPEGCRGQNITQQGPKRKQRHHHQQQQQVEKKGMALGPFFRLRALPPLLGALKLSKLPPFKKKRVC